ncbi:MogA/MoaB family molybdenum cofactor biosynthesis protein [Methanogenium organophilum]|uniref:MogA/MoaB family molybdenum cofactor biosynthesis protein n=1 Tax=Methanogenium organophilum TaxID=2199 RepID=A0A9X9S6R3_METOG|nr:MogA/MoaB family molybdenum cofactor biosynthesis protein [Methanogenium organophilum]WAI02430.1 MogA/MoaB family molybdenum cofactor biosynthesis protein [Methanogenium organophilum]
MDTSHLSDVSLQTAVITVSTSRTAEEDVSGAVIKELSETADIPVAFYQVVPDDIVAIRDALRKALPLASCIIINGGTGITHDDCTIEAVAPLFEKTLDGFGEIFRMLSYEDVGTRVLLSRAAAGIIEQRAVFCIPGSTSAVRLAMVKLILPEMRHIVTHANK